MTDTYKPIARALMTSVVYEDPGALARLYDFLRLLELDDAAIDRVAHVVGNIEAMSPYMDVRARHLRETIIEEWEQVLSQHHADAFEGLFGPRYED